MHPVANNIQLFPAWPSGGTTTATTMNTPRFQFAHPRTPPPPPPQTGHIATATSRATMLSAVAHSTMAREADRCNLSPPIIGRCTNTRALRVHIHQLPLHTGRLVTMARGKSWHTTHPRSIVTIQSHHHCWVVLASATEGDTCARTAAVSTT